MQHSEKWESSEALGEDRGRENGEPHDPDTNLRAIAACEQLLARGDLAAAKQQLLLIDAMAPDNEADWRRLYALCLKLNDRTHAQLYTERFLKVCKESAAAHLANARNFMPNMGDWEKVREAVAAALLNPGSDAGFWREVATIQNAIRDHGPACISARKSISLDPSDAEIRELLIASLHVLRRKSEVRTECAALAHCLTQHHHGDPLRWASLAHITAEAGPGAWKQAKAYIDIAESCLTKVNYVAEFELLRALILTKQPARAAKHLEQVLQSNSQNNWLWTTILEMAMSRRYFDIALTAIARLKAIPHQDPQFLYSLSLKEKTALKSLGGIFRGSVWRWVWPYR